MMTRFVLSIAVILIFSQMLTTSGQERSPPPMDVIFLVDLSGSMRFTDPDRIVLSAIADFIDKLAPDVSRVGVIGFSGGILHSIPFTYVDTERKASLRYEISLFEYLGYTDIGLAFMYAIEMIENVPELNNPMIIFTSDGYIEISRRNVGRTAQMSYDDVEAALDILEHIVPVYTVGMHNPDGIDVALLEMIANRSGGLSKFTYEADELPEILAAIFEHHVMRSQEELPELNDEYVWDNNEEAYAEEVVIVYLYEVEQVEEPPQDDEVFEEEVGVFEIGALHYLAIFFGFTALVSLLRFISIAL